MDAMTRLLRSVPLFHGLSVRELGEIRRAGEDVQFQQGATIVTEGLLAGDFYLVLEGRAEVLLRGRRRRVLEAGDYFGEMSVIDGGPRSATVRALTRVTALRLDRREFLRLLDREGSIGRKILLVMSERLRAAERTPSRY